MLITALVACQVFHHSPKDARTADPALAAKVSLAMCEAGVRMNALTLAADGASAKALADATAPSITMLHQVAKRGGPRWQVIADEAIANLERSMVVRLRAAEPHDADATTRATVEAMIAPWQGSAAAALAEAESLKVKPAVGAR